jgi:ABC-type antimicrobial peptide transport system permease subunit
MKSILLSESLGKKLFGDNDPLNQVVVMDARSDLVVTGVYEDLPKNSEFAEAAYFAPLDLYLEGAPQDVLNKWDNYYVNIYVEIYPEGDFEEISAMIKDATLPYVNDETVRAKQEIFLHPMSEWHLNSEFENGVLVTSGRMMSVWYFSMIGGFVLLLACINFMNLSTARAEGRAKEVGIRKSIGSLRHQLIQQFYGESFLVSFLSFGASIVFVQLVLPWFNKVSDKAITIPWANPVFWLICMGLIAVAGLLAGSYPALYLSSFKPVSALKGAFKAGRGATLPRKILVVAQFSVSIMLAVGTIVVYQQIQYAKNRPVGYATNGLIELRSAQPEFKGKYQVLREELLNTGMVEEIAECNYAVTDIRGWDGGFWWHGHEYEESFNTVFATSGYGKAIGLEFVEGRDFSPEMTSDSSGILINESALRLLGIKDPVGEDIKWAPRGTDRGTYQILGVVKDMIKYSPYEPTFPCIIFLSKNDLRWLYIRITPNVNPHEALPKIGEVLGRLVPSAPFDYTFVDEAYQAKFRAEERIASLATFFSVLAILISCLGLFGLASFVAERRTKEIGIRKVLGASVADLWQMLSRDFVVLVIISCAIAIPLSYYFMSNWLENYEYRTDISGQVFAVTAMGALVVTLLTVSFQILKVAFGNPVDSLRSE